MYGESASEKQGHHRVSVPRSHAARSESPCTVPKTSKSRARRSEAAAMTVVVASSADCPSVVVCYAKGPLIGQLLSPLANENRLLLRLDQSEYYKGMYCHWSVSRSFNQSRASLEGDSWMDHFPKTRKTKIGVIILIGTSL